jgi:hypothetical protein
MNSGEEIEYAAELELVADNTIKSGRALIRRKLIIMSVGLVMTFIILNVLDVSEKSMIAATIIVASVFLASALCHWLLILQTCLVLNNGNAEWFGKRQLAECKKSYRWAGVDEED